MRVKAIAHIILGSGHPDLHGLSCMPDDIFDLPEHEALKAAARGLVIIIEPKTRKPIIEAAIDPGPPRERAVSQRGSRGRFTTKAETVQPPPSPLPPANGESHDEL